MAKKHEEKLRFQITVVTKTWVNVDDHDEGLNVNTQYSYAPSVKEAEVVIKQLIRAVPDAVQALGFYTKINMVEQWIDQ